MRTVSYTHLDVYKRQVLVECGKMLEKNGYIIKSLNTINFRKSMHYNPCLLYTSLFEHDEFTMKPVLDETGRLIPREDYRLSTLNCGGEDFAVACMRANLRYGKNQRREDVKSHHYIISFDPRDGPDNGLTVDRAQALGEQFCKEHFPGHQALVCTHPDGDVYKRQAFGWTIPTKHHSRQQKPF